ncbi:hypothetical protein [uncultured Lentibacter sp.]|nr:hypothetical protein [uncultured Lentibacter sp.]
MILKRGDGSCRVLRLILETGENVMMRSVILVAAMGLVMWLQTTGGA